MTEAVVSVLLENLTSFIQKEVGSFMGVKDELERLSSQVTTIQAVLADAEMKQFTDDSIRNWLQKLEDAAYVLDDIIDECSTKKIEQAHLKQKHGWANKVHASYHSSFGLKDAVFRRKMANKMKKIREKLDNIAEERRRFHLCETCMISEKRAELMDWRQTTSVITQPEVYGREQDKEKIVQSLIGSTVENFTVYTVVGIGGLGKTTLAQLVYNDHRVTENFELKIWVCVSEDFSLKRMIKAILQSVLRRACQDLDLDPLQKQLQQELHGKRYLLVLDDVWSEDQEKWDRLRYSLAACGSKGASLLVTTRLVKVASIMGTLPPHDLSHLSEDECWSLFKQRAFGSDREENADLVAIGKEIVKKCKGLPLAAKALGGLLRFKREEKDWLHFKESEIWNLPQDEHSLLPALRLSYLNLPLISRRCFSYCAIFEKDEWIYKEELVRLWMANGFVSSRGTVMAEDMADWIIHELCWASFFQDIHRDTFGNVMSFKIHDLLHDLAQSVTRDVCYCFTNNERSIEHPKRIHHLTINCIDKAKEFLHQVESLRTVRFRKFISLRASDMLRFGSLRAFHVIYFEYRINKLLSSSSHFKHLRYLNLQGCRYKILPTSICSLWNLQSLNLNDCVLLKELPKHLKCLKALRHLCLRGCTSLSRMSPDIGRLTFLRTLNIYVVGKRKGFRLTELGSLNLKGELHIKNLERVTNVVDAVEANLKGKQLYELFLSWGNNGQSELEQNVEHIIEALEPHPKLGCLKVVGYRGVDLPRWMGNPSFHNLCYLTLIDCIHIIQLPKLGKLPSLKKLEIDKMDHVRYVDEESYDGGVARGFPSLETLILDSMPILERLSKQEGGDVFPCLYDLQITACPKLMLPSLSSVRSLTVCPKVSGSALDRHLSPTLVDSIHNLNGLEFLGFREDQKLTSFTVGMFRDLACLKVLHITDQSKLEVLPIELVSLVALEELYIEGCHSLECLTEQVLKGLRSLKRLAIVWCRRFKGLSTGFQNLASLKELRIQQCPQIVALSQDIQHMPPLLESLVLYDLQSLECLPDCWGSLTSLQSLRIEHCPKLTSLPSSSGWRANLKSLIIVDSPELQKRFEKEKGQD